MVGALSEEDVTRMLVRKAEETIFSLFLWEQGTFAFEEGALPKQPMIPISLRVQDILLEGVKAVDDLQRIRQEFRSPRAILRRTAKAIPPEALADRLTADGIEASVLDLRTLAPLDRAAVLALARRCRPNLELARKFGQANTFPPTTATGQRCPHVGARLNFHRWK